MEDLKENINGFDIIHKSWTDGGTLITNLNPQSYIVCEKSIEEYSKIKPNDVLVLSKKSFDSYGYEFEYGGSLHHLYNSDLSLFWRIFDDLKCK